MASNPALRIGIGAQILGKGKGGVETCVAALIEALAELETPHEFYLYLSPGHPLRPGLLPANFKLRVLPSANPWLERPLWLPLAFRRDRPHVVFLQRALPLWGCPPSVLHLHDAMYAARPELFPAWKRRLLIQIFRRSIRRSMSVVTPSAAAGEEIVRYYGAPPEKVVVVPNAVDVRQFHPSANLVADDAAIARFGLRRPYVAYLGAVERNKNLHVLVDAFASFAEQHKEFDLAVVGKWRQETRGGYYESLVEQVSRAGLSDRVRFTGYVSDADRAALLANASMMVFPSVAEGFGLPPIEAMACGVPVVASRIPALKEVCRDAALFAEPNSVDDLCNQMAVLAADPDLRARLIRLGSARVAEFSWTQSAKKLLDVLVSAAQSR